jgi:O-antigen ligase
VARFTPSEFERATLVGRRIGIEAAARIWQQFPIAGSGLGTFERVVSMEQTQDLAKIYHHAHNDYMEVAATSGTLGFMIALVELVGGYAAMVRQSRDRELSWRRRAFQYAALASLTIAMVHSLFDFNLFIPANPATLAVILGAAAASVDRDRRLRR